MMLKMMEADQNACSRLDGSAEDRVLARMKGKSELRSLERLERGCQKTRTSIRGTARAERWHDG